MVKLNPVIVLHDLVAIMQDCDCCFEYDSVTGENVLEECDACKFESMSTRDEILHLIATYPSQGEIEDKTPFLLELLILMLKEPVDASVQGAIRVFIENCKKELPELYKAFQETLDSSESSDSLDSSEPLD